MKREADLYQEQFRRAKPVLSARMSLRLAAGVLAGLVLIYGLGQWGVSIQSGRLESLREQLAAERNRIAQLAETHPPAEKDPDIEAEVQELTAERDARTRLLRALSTESLGNVGGFSRHVAGLARQRVAGLWLREIRIGRGGRELELVGSTLEADLVPHFIQQLGRESAFAGGGFQSLRLQRSETELERIDFALSTAPEALP